MNRLTTINDTGAVPAVIDKKTRWGKEGQELRIHRVRKEPPETIRPKQEDLEQAQEHYLQDKSAYEEALSQRLAEAEANKTKIGNLSTVHIQHLYFQDEGAAEVSIIGGQPIKAQSVKAIYSAKVKNGSAVDSMFLPMLYFSGDYAVEQDLVSGAECPIVDQDDYYVYLLESDQTSFTVIYSNLEHSYYDTQRLGSIGYQYTIHSRIDHQPVIVYIFRDPTKTAVFGTGSGKEGYLEVSLSAIFYYKDGKRVHFSEDRPALLSIAELRSNLDPHLPDIGRYEYVSEFSGAIIPVTGSTIQRQSNQRYYSAVANNRPKDNLKQLLDTSKHYQTSLIGSIQTRDYVIVRYGVVDSVSSIVPSTLWITLNSDLPLKNVIEKRFLHPEGPKLLPLPQEQTYPLLATPETSLDSNLEATELESGQVVPTLPEPQESQPLVSEDTAQNPVEPVPTPSEEAATHDDMIDGTGEIAAEQGEQPRTASRSNVSYNSKFLSTEEQVWEEAGSTEPLYPDTDEFLVAQLLQQRNEQPINQAEPSLDEGIEVAVGDNISLEEILKKIDHKKLPVEATIEVAELPTTAVVGKRQATLYVAYPNGKRSALTIPVTVFNPMDRLTYAERYPLQVRGPVQVQQREQLQKRAVIDQLMIATLPVDTRLEIVGMPTTDYSGIFTATVKVHYGDGTRAQVSVPIEIIEPEPLDSGPEAESLPNLSDMTVNYSHDLVPETGTTSLDQAFAMLLGGTVLAIRQNNEKTLEFSQHQD